MSTALSPVQRLGHNIASVADARLPSAAKTAIRHALPTAEDGFVRAGAAEASGHYRPVMTGKKSWGQRLEDSWARTTRWIGSHKMEAALATSILIGGILLLDTGNRKKTPTRPLPKPYQMPKEPAGFNTWPQARRDAWFQGILDDIQKRWD